MQSSEWVSVNLGDTKESNNSQAVADKTSLKKKGKKNKNSSSFEKKVFPIDFKE